jgi:protoheme IX farnesyltransferase
MSAKSNVIRIGGREVSALSRALSAVKRTTAAYLELTKPRVTLLVTLTAAAGFYLGSPPGAPPDVHLLWHTCAAVWLLSSGIAALNQYMERAEDGLMLRTARRPLPSGEMAPARALLFGLTLTVIAQIYLAARAGMPAALLGLAVMTGYLLLYTPLKTRTPHSTSVGAIPGALPPLVGWAAARGHLGVEAWALFAIMFLWQFPHFFAIARLHREDYERAGIRMLPVVEPGGRRTAHYVVVTAMLLVLTSLLPSVLGLTGFFYAAGAFALGIAYFTCGVTVSQRRLRSSKFFARRLLYASVLYLPLLFLIMVMDKR